MPGDRSTATSHDPFGPDPIVVAYGAGVDSTAMLVGLRKHNIALSAILFADTGSEKPETVAYLITIEAWLRRNGMPPVTVVKRRSLEAAGPEAST